MSQHSRLSEPRRVSIRFVANLASRGCKFPVVCAAVALALLAATPAPARAADRVDFVVGPEAPALDLDAANEAANQFQRLFGVETVIVKQIPADVEHLVLIGNPVTNPASKQLLGDRWPKMNYQGILIRSFEYKGKPALVLGGGGDGTGASTFWAVCEFGYRNGIRYLLHEDIYPATAVPLKLDGYEILMNPALRTRTWRTVNDFAIGPESWGAADQKKLFRQLAKMKFNRVLLSVYPWQPFVHYEFKGVKKQSAMLWFGDKFRVDGDTPGKVAFNGATFFENPDFAGKTTYEQMTDAGVRHMRALIDAAHEVGMTVELAISPLEFPKEFAAVLPGSRESKGLNNLLIAPGAAQSPQDPELRQLTRIVVRAYLETYPKLDALCLSLPEFPEWEEQAEAAWKQLDAEHSLAPHTLEELIVTARQRHIVASGERGVRSLKGNVATLAFLNSLVKDSGLLARPDGTSVELSIADIDPALFPILDRVLPQGASALNFVDYTARRVVENKRLLSQVPADRTKSRLILTLADDNVGVLPQAATQRIETLVSELAKNQWDGFSTRYWIAGELDPAVHYLSRAAFDPKITARQAHDELFVGITGKASVADRLWKAFDHIEQATELIDKNDLGFAFPVEGMMLKHSIAEPPPAWWKDAIAHYTEASNELYRSHDAADPRSRKLLFYYAKRSEYVLEYLTAVGAVRAAAVAQKAGKTDEAANQLGTAVEQLYNAIDTLSDVARDQSDRGLIAVLAQYAYRPLVEKANAK